MLNLRNGVLELRTPYNAGLVAAIKSLPASDRRFEPNSKSWLIAPKHAAIVAGLVEAYLGQHVEVPHPSGAVDTVQKTLDVIYSGACKERPGETENTAFGWADDGWNVIMPEPVLRAWFCAEANPVDKPTLYAVIGVHKDATGDELKQAFRRMAKQWHPDVCHEPNAAEQFKAINHAYSILSDSIARGKYDAGLRLEASHKRDYNPHTTVYGDYRAPLRCGRITATGHYSVGRFVIEKILDWKDIVDARGRTLVTSWPRGAKTFEERWV